MSKHSTQFSGILASRAGNYAMWLLLPVVVFVYLCGVFNFTQDDTYITLRYAENFAHGHGLVWNVGERVEGYTNFLWLILLIFFKSIGVSYFAFVNVCGVALSVSSLVLAFLFVREQSQTRWASITALGVTLIISCNYSFIYWTVAGLETPLFTFLAFASLYFYFRRHWLYVAAVTLAILTRPEGILLAGFFPLFRLIETRRIPRQELIGLGIVALLIAPFVLFKLMYFGDVKPNPYYAKTAWDTQQLRAGVDYVWQFLSGYALYGVAFLLPWIRYRRLSTPARGALLFATLYTIYILVVGGDVLKVNRFFLPVLLGLYAPFLLSIESLAPKVWAVGLVTVAMITVSFVAPYNHVSAYLAQERGFNQKMLKVAGFLKETGEGDFSLATPTIGAIGYELIGHNVYDMVGLTDTMVARHPQEPVPGLASSWRERKYNSEYILSRAPTYILFSTGYKPSSPGERTLFLYPAFLDGYRVTGFHSNGRMHVVYQLRGDSAGEIKREFGANFVMNYTAGIQSWSEKDYKSAVSLLAKAAYEGPSPPYPPLLYIYALSAAALSQDELAFRLLNKAVELDSEFVLAHAELYTNLYRYPEYRQQALLHREFINRYAPWVTSQMDSAAWLFDQQERQRQ